MLSITSHAQRSDVWAYWHSNGSYLLSYIDDAPAGGCQITIPLPTWVLFNIINDLGSGRIEDKKQLKLELPDGHHI